MTRDVDYKLNNEWGQVLNLNSRLGTPGHRVAQHQLPARQPAAGPDPGPARRLARREEGHVRRRLPDAARARRRRRRAGGHLRLHARRRQDAAASRSQPRRSSRSTPPPPCRSINPERDPQHARQARAPARASTSRSSATASPTAPRPGSGGATAPRPTRRSSRTACARASRARPSPKRSPRKAAAAPIDSQSVFQYARARPAQRRQPHRPGRDRHGHERHGQADARPVQGRDDRLHRRRPGGRGSRCCSSRRCSATRTTSPRSRPTRSDPRWRSPTPSRKSPPRQNATCVDVHTEWVNQATRGIPPFSQLHNMFNHPGVEGMKVYANAILRAFPAVWHAPRLLTHITLLPTTFQRSCERWNVVSCHFRRAFLTRNHRDGCHGLWCRFDR